MLLHLDCCSDSLESYLKVFELVPVTVGDGGNNSSGLQDASIIDLFAVVDIYKKNAILCGKQHFGIRTLDLGYFIN